MLVGQLNVLVPFHSAALFGILVHIHAMLLMTLLVCGAFFFFFVSFFSFCFLFFLSLPFSWITFALRSISCPADDLCLGLESVIGHAS